MKGIVHNGDRVLSDYYLFDDILKKRHEAALPPKEAYLYFPKDDIVVCNSSKPDKIIRRIFSGVIFTPFENVKYKELQNEIVKRSIILPKWWVESESHRFLQATAFDIDKAIIYILKQISWRTNYFPLLISNHIIEILNTGFMYIHGRDIRYRPVFIIQAKKYFEISQTYSYDELFLAIIYFVEYIINHLLIIGQVENWVMISDLTDVNAILMPRDLKRVIDALSSCYRCRLYKNFILGLSTRMRWLFKICTSCIGEVTLQKISVLETGKWDIIKMYINEDNLEMKFGGKAKDICIGKHNYFPPVMPCDNYSFPGEKVLISESEYKERRYHEESSLSLPLIIGQYYKDKWAHEEKEEALNGERRKKKDKSIKNKETIDILGAGIKTELRKNDHYQTFITGRMFLGLKEIIKFDQINNASPCNLKKRGSNPPMIKEGELSSNWYSSIEV